MAADSAYDYEQSGFVVGYSVEVTDQPYEDHEAAIVEQHSSYGDYTNDELGIVEQNSPYTYTDDFGGER